MAVVRSPKSESIALLPAQTPPESTFYWLLKHPVHYIGKGLLTIALLGEFPFAWFSRTYTGKGITQTAQRFSNSIEDLPDTFGALSKYTTAAPTVVEICSDASAASELYNGLTLFGLSEELHNIDKGFRDAFRDGGLSGWLRSKCSEYCGYSFKKIAFIVVSQLSFEVASIAGAYGDAEELEESFNYLLGSKYAILGIGTIVAGAYCYYKVGFGGKVADGMKFQLGEEPGLTTISERYRDHRSVAIEAQAAFEQGATAIGRAFSMAFLLGRLAENRKWSSPVAYYTLGGITGVINASQGFAPASWRKYFANSANVTQAERDQAYNETYGNMSTVRYLLTELKRPFVIGYAQVGTAAYFVTKWTFDPIQNTMRNAGCPEWLTAAASAFPLYVTIALSYRSYYQANLYAELNATVAAQKAMVEQQEKAALVSVEVDDSVADDSVVPAPKEAEERIENEAYCGGWQAQLDAKSEEDEIRPNLCATVVGTTWSVISQVTRAFSQVASIFGNKALNTRLSKNDMTVIALSSASIIGENRFRVVTKPSVKVTAQLFGCGEKVPKEAPASAAGMFGGDRPSSRTISERQTRKGRSVSQGIIDSGEGDAKLREVTSDAGHSSRRGRTLSMAQPSGDE